MMKLDLFDKVLLAMLTMAVVAIAVYSVKAVPDKTAIVESRNMERELAAQARQGLLEKLYAPVNMAMQSAQYHEALLKLEEVNGRYPGEAHGFILKGEILRRMESNEEAAAAFVRGVKLNGDYIDKQSPLTRRPAIESLVNNSIAKAVVAYRNTPVNPAMKEHLANLNYLKSRLAGGCE